MSAAKFKIRGLAGIKQIGNGKDAWSVLVMTFMGGRLEARTDPKTLMDHVEEGKEYEFSGRIEQKGYNPALIVERTEVVGENKKTSNGAANRLAGAATAVALLVAMFTASTVMAANVVEISPHDGLTVLDQYQVLVDGEVISYDFVGSTDSQGGFGGFGFGGSGGRYYDYEYEAPTGSLYTLQLFDSAGGSPNTFEGSFGEPAAAPDFIFPTRFIFDATMTDVVTPTVVQVIGNTHNVGSVPVPEVAGTAVVSTPLALTALSRRRRLQ